MKVYECKIFIDILKVLEQSLWIHDRNKKNKQINIKSESKTLKLNLWLIILLKSLIYLFICFNVSVYKSFYSNLAKSFFFLFVFVFFYGFSKKKVFVFTFKSYRLLILKANLSFKVSRSIRTFLFWNYIIPLKQVFLS